MKLHTLQAARAIAAWLVIADHALLQLTGNQPELWLTHVAWTLGSTGVDAFFVISGFIMVHISWESFGVRGAAADFLYRRLLRIAPLYWLATLVALAYHRVSATHGANAGWTELLNSFAFIPHIDSDGSWGPILPQGWTLSYEVLFYCLFTLGLFLPRRTALPAVVATLGAFVLTGPALGSTVLTYLASPIVLWFALGIGLAVLWRRLDLAEPAWLTRYAQIFEPFGDASYSTYLVHGFVLTMLLRAWTMLVAPPSLWLVPPSLIAATVVGLAVHRAVERPLLQIVSNACRPGRPVAKWLNVSRTG